jgi:[ribosomal protein S18]-alanine N-acetyltransferase
MRRRLRSVLPEDLNRLARLHAQCFAEERWDARALAELLAMKGASGHLLEDGTTGLPQGLILDLLLAEDAEILTLCVAPPARRQGIARLLLEDLFRRAGLLGARSVSLEVAADNQAARRLYEALGFAPAGQRPGYYRRGRGTVDALLFRRALAP